MFYNVLMCVSVYTLCTLSAPTLSPRKLYKVPDTLYIAMQRVTVPTYGILSMKNKLIDIRLIKCHLRTGKMKL